MTHNPKIDTNPIAGIVPEGLVGRLESFQKWVLPGSPIEDVLKEAADVLRKLPPKLSDKQRLESLTFESNGYRIDSDCKSKTIRIVYFAKHNESGVLAYRLFDSSDAYEFAGRVLKAFDHVEGIDDASA
jgi:hypothetical protein